MTSKKIIINKIDRTSGTFDKVRGLIVTEI